MIPTCGRSMTMPLSRRFLSHTFLLIGLLAAIQNPVFLAPRRVDRNRDILRNVQEALMDPRGHELSVEWQTRFEGESWQGEGTLQILGSDYLMLTLPYQKVLIKKTTVMTWYRKTDQVIIDYFDRDDPSNLFSILLGDFSHFSVHESKALSDSITILRLKAKWLVGFEELELTVNEVTWMPEAITAEAGDGWTVTIQVLEDLPLKYPENLVNATLEGSGMIDLTE